MKKEIINLLLEDDIILLDTVRNINRYNNSLEDLRIYENDTDTLNLFFSKGYKTKPIDYCYSDDYLIIDFQKNIYSFNYDEIIILFKKHVNRIADTLINICLELTTAEIYSKLDLNSEIVQLIEAIKNN
jgi:hypothetical protein